MYSEEEDINSPEVDATTEKVKPPVLGDSFAASHLRQHGFHKAKLNPGQKQKRKVSKIGRKQRKANRK